MERKSERRLLGTYIRTRNEEIEKKNEKRLYSSIYFSSSYSKKNKWILQISYFFLFEWRRGCKYHQMNSLQVRNFSLKRT